MGRSRILNAITLFWIIAIFFFSGSCSNTYLVSENRQLKSRIAELDHRIYELSESPNKLAQDLIHDLNLLISVPYHENLVLALDLLDTFQKNYPNSKYKTELNNKRQEIVKLQARVSKDNAQNKSSSKFNHDQSDNAKLQISAQLGKRRHGFINMELKVQNLSNLSLNNIWVKASLIDSNGQPYGITQDFFFGYLGPYDYKLESLSWEYVRIEEIKGIRMSEIKHTLNRQTTLLKNEQCRLGQSNVKIFLELD